jgi:hypothetical protein
LNNRAAVLLLGLGIAACAPARGYLAGRLVAEGHPVEGATVSAKQSQGALRVEATTDPTGVYRFPPLPPGAYRVAARTEGSEGRMGAAPGKNPVQVAAGRETWVGLQAVPWEEPGFRPREAAPGHGSLAGTVRFAGRPVAGAVVNLYLDEAEALRGPGFRQSFATGEDGAYTLEEVPAGRYFAVARRRAAGGAFGPVREGDLYGEALANPIPVREGHETRLDLHLVRKERDDDPNAELLRRSGTGLRGQVVDPNGTPVAGVYVFAYRDRIIGHRMPDFLTLPTAEDGAFSLALEGEGVFYVGARERSGGSPAPGEWFGFYEGSPDHGVRVSAGRILSDVEIVVRRVLAP